MPTRIQDHQIVHEALLTVLGRATRAELKDIVDAIETELNVPLRLRAETTPTSKLVIGASQIATADGGKQVAPSLDDVVGNFAEATIDFQTFALTGGTVKRDNATFSALPTSALVGNFRIAAFVYVPSGNYVNCTFSAEAATEGALVNPGSVYAGLDGVPMDYLVLVSTDTAGKYKTVGAGTSVIQNAGIRRFGSSGGAGGGADKTYKISGFSTTSATVKGGYRPLDTGIVLASGTGTTSATAGADLTANLNTVLTNSGLAALGTINSASAKRFVLAIDLFSLAATPTTLTDNLRSVYFWGESNLRLLDLRPDQVDPRRYVWIDEVWIAQTVTVWTAASVIHKPPVVHDSLAAFFPYLEPYSTQITSGSGLQTLSHALSAEPQIVLAYYFDGTNKQRIDDQNVVVHKSATQIKVSVDAYDVTGGKYVEIVAFRVPGLTAVASSSRTFTSAWFQSNATTTLPHALTDREDIRGYEVQEYDTVANRVRNVDRSALVVNFDDTNFYLNWTGLSPSATLQYRVVAGGSPLPWSIPVSLTGYTKYAGQGPGSYATVTAALAASAAGDRVLIMRDMAETGALVVPAGVQVDQMPNTLVTLTATAFASGAIRFTGANAQWRRMNAKVTGITGTLAKAISVEAADCKVEGDLEIDTSGQTVTDAVNIAVGGTRAYVQVGVKKTAGTLTNLETNADGAGKSDVWGG